MKRVLPLLLCLAAAAPARAGGALPVPLPPSAAAAAAAPAEALPPVALTPELLARWGYDVGKVMALPPDKKAELQSALTRLELGRLRRLELLRRVRPDDWRSYVDERELLTPEGDKLVDAYLASMAGKPLLVPAQIKDFERADGKPLTAEDLARARRILDRLFDGVAAGDKKLGGDVVVDAHVRDETVYDVTVTSPKTGLALSVGQLYVDDQHPLAESSPYANLTWGKDSKPDSGVDYRFKASLGYVDLRSRYFSDDSGANAGVNQALALGSQLGVPQSSLNQISKYATYDDPYEAHGIIVSSLLAQLGRAYHVAGPVDVSWTMGGLIKTMWVAPNAAFDETLGLRVRMKNGMSLGFFGGVAQNVSPVGNDLLQQALGSGTIAPGLYLEDDPHAGVALWGKVPGASDLSFSMSASERWTSETRAYEGDASLMTTFWRHPLTMKADYSHELGTSIAYDREKERAELDYGFAHDAQATLAYQRDHVLYGNAEVNSNSVMAGFKIEFGGHGSLTVDQLMGGQYKGAAANDGQFQQELTQIQRDLSAGVDALDKINRTYQNLRPGLDPAAAEGQLNSLSLALSRLNPDQASALIDQLKLTPAQQTELGNLWLKTVSPASPYYNQIAGLLSSGSSAAQGAGRLLGKADNWSNYFSAHEGEIRRLIALLGNEQVWDAAVVAAARGQMLAAMKQFGKVNVPILGGDFTLRVDAPAILAASNILQSRLSPLAPLTPGQADAWLTKEAGAELGLSGTPTNAQIAGALFGMADAQMKQQLASSLAPLAGQLGGLGTQQALAAKILASVPPNVSNLLKQNYGPSLTGLIPPNLTSSQLKAYLNQLPGQITSFLEKRYGTQVAAGIGQAVSWAGDLLSRQVNMTMIQLMLASEELDRLTADHGEKIDALDLGMAMRSFDELDARGQGESRRRLDDIKDMVVQRTDADEARLAAKFQLHGKTVLQTLQLSPSWPQGLRVTVDEDAWMPLMTLYGDGHFFELVEQFKKKYQAASHPNGLTVEIGYRVNDTMGCWITTQQTPAPLLKIDLTRPRDERDAEFRLQNLADYVGEMK